MTRVSSLTTIVFCAKTDCTANDAKTNDRIKIALFIIQNVLVKEWFNGTNIRQNSKPTKKFAKIFCYLQNKSSQTPNSASLKSCNVSLFNQLIFNSWQDTKNKTPIWKNKSAFYCGKTAFCPTETPFYFLHIKIIFSSRTYKHIVIL